MVYPRRSLSGSQGLADALGQGHFLRPREACRKTAGAAPG